MNQERALQKILKSINQEQPAFTERQSQIIQKYLNYAYVIGVEEGYKYSSRKRPVKQVDIKTGKVIETFESAAQAARKIHGDRGNILNCAKGKKATYKKFKWFYAEQYNY